MTNIKRNLLAVGLVCGGLLSCAKPAFGAGGSVVGWGANDSGQISPPADLTNAVRVAAAYSASAAVRDNGSVVAWGGGWPAPPADLTNVVALAAATFFFCAVKADGNPVIWGPDVDPDLQTIPAGLHNAIDVAGGGAFYVTRNADGSLTAWGRMRSQISPVQFVPAFVPPGLSNVTAIAAGGGHALALRPDGTVVAWGPGMGFGETNVPTGLSNVVAISCGYTHSLALKADGTVVAWGSDGSGQASVPSGLSGVVAVAGGESHSVALKNDGSIVCWGSVPGPAAVTDATAIAQGGDARHGLAIVGAMAPTILNQPAGTRAFPGSPAAFSVSVSGTLPLHYQWSFNGGNIAGATNSHYSIPSVQVTNAGLYAVSVTNLLGAATSTPALLSLAPLAIRMCAVLSVAGPVGSQVEVDYTEDLSNPVWVMLTNLTLPFSPFPYVCDWDSAGRPKRFYRVVVQP